MGDDIATDGVLYHNWFLFAIPTPAVGQTYVGATLRLFNPVFFSSNVSETYSVTDYTGSLTNLVADNGNGNGSAIYNDLGAGSAYGTATISSANNGGFVEIALTPAALASINAASGTNFALGGFLSTLDSTDNTEFAFGSSGTGPLSNTQLVLAQGSVAGPEPGSLALLMLGTTAGIVSARHKRKEH